MANESWEGMATTEESLEEERNKLTEDSEYLIALQKQVKKQKKALKTVKKALVAKTDFVKDLEVDLDSLKDKFATTRARYNGMNRRIEKLTLNFDQFVQQEKAQLLEKKLEASELHMNCQKVGVELQESCRSHQLEFEKYGRQVKEAVDRRTDLYLTLDSEETKLLTLEAEDGESVIHSFDNSDPLAFIDSDFPYFHDADECSPEDICNVENPKKCVEAMENFVKVLEQNIHRFKHMPVGPLFKNAVVNHRKWAPLAECVLRPYLFSFIVDNIVDGLVMEEIVSEHFPNSAPGSLNSQGVFCPKHYLFDFNSQFPIGPTLNSVSGVELENMLDVVQFDKDVWGRFLSQRIGIEKIVFMENEHTAFLVMSTIQRSPWYCKVAYTLDGFVVDPFPCFRTKLKKFHEKAIYLKCMPSMEIGEMKSKIRKTRKQIETINKELQQLRDRQMGIAKRLDQTRAALVEAAEYEETMLLAAQLLETKFNETITIGSEKRHLKQLKSCKKNLAQRVATYTKLTLDEKAALQTLQTEATEVESQYETLVKELKAKEVEFFAKREEFWKREEEFEFTLFALDNVKRVLDD